MSTQDLVSINNDIREAEFRRDDAFFNDLLTEDFLFRRANKTFDTKESYLKKLHAYRYDLPEAGKEKIIPMDDQSAYAEIILKAQGIRDDGSKFGGNFKNTRFFRNSEGKWKLYAWYNEEIKNGSSETKEPAPPPVRIGENISFSGEVLVQALYNQGLPEGIKWYHVLFTPRARTFWHIHPEGQDLFITAGVAWVVFKLNDVNEVNRVESGQHIVIPRGVMHWHGAAGNSFMSHFASNHFTVSRETSYWFNEVTEDDYESAKFNEKVLTK